MNTADLFSGVEKKISNLLKKSWALQTLQVTTPLLTEQLEDEFFEALQNKAMAQTHIGSLHIRSTHEDASDVLRNGFFIYTIQTLEIPSHSFQFSMHEFGFPMATKPKFDAYSVNYIDTFGWDFTKLLHSAYSLQIVSDTFLLHPQYKHVQIEWKFGEHLLSFTDCAISRPLESSYSSVAAALGFSFKFVYSAMTDVYMPINSNTSDLESPSVT